MKKTLNALVCAALVAPAFAEMLTIDETSGYIQGNDYTLTLTLNSTLNEFGNHQSEYILTTAEKVNIFTQRGQYIGVEKDGNGVLSSSDANNKYGQELITVTAGESEFWFKNFGDANRLESLTLKFECDIETSTTKISITKPEGDGSFTTPIVLNVTSVIDPTQIKYNNTVVTDLKSEFVSTPEPATATLSLLALAGLAARRRR